MVLVNNALGRAIILSGLGASLGACAMFGGGDGGLARADAGQADLALQELPANGPQSDYPQVLGDAFTVDGQEYVPVDTASYDAVGYAALDGEGGAGITLAHKTLPMPSYVEVTELTGGRTILARVERRGPMTGSRLIALSPGAQALLGIADGAPVRVRRVNPPETDRLELRAGRKAADRMDTPKSLLTVLQRKLPPAGVGYAPVRAAQALPASAQPAAKVAIPPSTSAPVPAQVRARPAAPAQATTAPLASPPALATAERAANTAYPLGGARPASSAAARPQATRARPAVQPAGAASPAAPPQNTAAASAAKGDFVIQAAAFSSKANADKAAGKIGGFVTRSGALYRVRTGPYANRGQAEAALAKVRAAGYSDARVFTAG